MLRTIYLFLVVTIGIIFTEAGACTGTSAVGGTVFRDYNANGSQDTNEPVVNSGTVYAYSVGSAVKSAAIQSDGTYCITVDSFPARLELRDFPSYLKAGVLGAASEGTIRFVSAASANQSFALQNPAQFCEDKPDVAVACYLGGSGVGSSDPAIIRYGYDVDGVPTSHSGGTQPNPVSLTDIQSVGTTYGLAFQRAKSRLFASASLKRHAGFGPQGIGGVYVLQLDTSGNLTSLDSFTLQGVTPANSTTPISLGNINRTNVSGAVTNDFQLSDTAAQPSIDLDAYAKVGKISYGQIALSEDEESLWLVNLFDQSLIEVDVQSNNFTSSVNSYDVTSLPGYISCSDGAARPYALTFHDGLGYLGLVCDASSAAAYATAELDAYVLSFNPEQISSGFNQVIKIDLNYTREKVWNSVDGAFVPWIDDYATDLAPRAVCSGSNISSGTPHGCPQPILSDIDFDHAGNMILGILDRSSQQIGNANRKPVSGGGNRSNNEYGRWRSPKGL